MRSYLAFILCLLIGTAAGLLLTGAVVVNGHGFGMEQAGPWRAWPKAGTATAEPYGRAIQARNGSIPLGAGEGIALFAQTTDDGARLDGRCDYHVHGNTPSARYWTLEAFSEKGSPIVGPLERGGFTSSEIVRAEDGSFDIALSALAMPGNWLQIQTTRPFVIVLRLYDTVLSANAFALDARLLPHITRGECP